MNPRYWDWSEWLLWSVMAACVLAIVLIVVAGVQSARAWDVYRKEHDCQRTGQSDTSTYLTPILSGKTTVLIPQTTTRYEWRCADGELVWR